MEIFGVRKLESLGYHKALFAWSCVWWTDRQTDGQTHDKSIYHASI